MNEREFNELRVQFGDEVIAGFLSECHSRVYSSGILYERLAQKLGDSPPLMMAFELLLVAERLLDDQRERGPDAREGVLEILNAMLAGTQPCWIRIAEEPGGAR